MNRPVVAVIMGSDSDVPVMKGCLDTLDKFGVSSEARILSAHRSPKEVVNFVSKAKSRGIKIIIAAAGGAAHLAGVIASRTVLPVIGVPMDTKSLKGIDSLFSTVQMPAGIPVATMAIGSSGAKNAAILAAQILALTDKKLRNKLESHKRELAIEVKKKNKALGKR